MDKCEIAAMDTPDDTIQTAVGVKSEPVKLLGLTLTGLED